MHIAHTHGVAMIDLPLCSNSFFTQEQINELLHIYNTAAYPMLIHCYGGADRTGAAATLWLLMYKHISYKQAKKQLSYRYFHIPFIHGKAMDKLIKTWKYSPVSPDRVAS